MGNLTRDPELKFTPNGTAVCTFGVATNRTWTTGTGETKEEVQFHRVVAWQKLAELCGKLLAKGRKLYLEGRIVYRSYTAKDGQEKNITEIIMSDFILFDDKYTKGIEADASVGTPPEPQEVETTDYTIDENLESPEPTSTDKADSKVKKSPTSEDKETTPASTDDDDIPF